MTLEDLLIRLEELKTQAKEIPEQVFFEKPFQQLVITGGSGVVSGKQRARPSVRTFVTRFQTTETESSISARAFASDFNSQLTDAINKIKDDIANFQEMPIIAPIQEQQIEQKGLSGIQKALLVLGLILIA